MLGELVTLRVAVREGWPVHPDVAGQIVKDLDAHLDSDNARVLIAVSKVFLAMVHADMDAERARPRGAGGAVGLDVETRGTAEER
jgi:hypothetical protein